MVERHGPRRRDIFAAVYDSQYSAGRGSLVVRVETEGASDVKGLFDVALAVEEGKHSHGTVKIGVPDGLCE